MKYSPDPVLAEKVRERSEASTIILKLGAEGALLHMQGADGLLHADQLPELNSLPRDVAGAGESLLVISALALVGGATSWEVAYIGAVAAVVQVSRTGNIPLTQADLINEIA